MDTSGIFSSRVWVNGKLQPATVWLKEGKILSIDQFRNEGAYNAGDSILMPGVIDVHVHMNEPGRTEWEGFNSATKAAAAGGVTTVIDMPLNSSPVTVNASAFDTKLNAARGQIHVNVGLYGGFIPGNQGQLEELIEQGVFGIKTFLTHSGIEDFPNVSLKDLDEAMPLIARSDIPLLVHCELSDEMHNRTLKENPASYKAYLDSRPKLWENKAIQMMIDLCRRHSCHVHIVHVSSAEALHLIGEAREEGLPVTAETCPHYIFFNAEQIPDGATIFKCAPPIREKSNNQLLKNALATRELDFISSDHSPAPPGMKEIHSGNFLKAWGGIAGLQFLLPAGWTALKDLMQPEEFIPLVTSKPAEFIKLDNRKGLIKEGYDADLVLWDPDVPFEVKEDEIFHKHKISPYVSQNLYGRVRRTYCGGELIFDNGEIVATGRGKILTT